MSRLDDIFGRNCSLTLAILPPKYVISSTHIIDILAQPYSIPIIFTLCPNGSRVMIRSCPEPASGPTFAFAPVASAPVASAHAFWLCCLCPCPICLYLCPCPRPRDVPSSMPLALPLSLGSLLPCFTSPALGCVDRRHFSPLASLVNRTHFSALPPLPHCGTQE